MRTDIASDQTCILRPLADAELDQATGGSAVLAFVAAAAIGGAVAYTLTHGTMGDGVRAALEAKGLH